MDDVVTDPGTVVIGAAILREGRLLGARRTAPVEAAGRWELPGGKVEPGEQPEEAIVREIREELGCEIEVVDLLADVVEIRPGVVLRVAVAELVAGEPVPHEHDAVRWLNADQLLDVDWLAPDVPFLATVRARLERGR